MKKMMMLQDAVKWLDEHYSKEFDMGTDDDMAHKIAIASLKAWEQVLKELDDRVVEVDTGKAADFEETRDNYYITGMMDSMDIIRKYVHGIVTP